MHSIADENMCVGMLCADGVTRDLWRVPGSFVTKLRDAKRIRRSDAIFRFTFFKRDNAHQLPRRADFIEKRTESKEVRRVKQVLARRP